MILAGWLVERDLCALWMGVDGLVWVHCENPLCRTLTLLQWCHESPRKDDFRATIFDRDIEGRLAEHLVAVKPKDGVDRDSSLAISKDLCS